MPRHTMRDTEVSILERAATALEQVGANLEKVVALLSEPTEPPRESNHKQED